MPLHVAPCHGGGKGGILAGAQSAKLVLEFSLASHKLVLPRCQKNRSPKRRGVTREVSHVLPQEWSITQGAHESGRCKARTTVCRVKPWNSCCLVWVYFCTPPYGTREEVPERNPNPDGGLAYQPTLPGTSGQGKGRTKKKSTQPNKSDGP